MTYYDRKWRISAAIVGLICHARRSRIAPDLRHIDGLTDRGGGQFSTGFRRPAPLYFGVGLVGAGALISTLIRKADRAYNNARPSTSGPALTESSGLRPINRAPKIPDWKSAACGAARTRPNRTRRNRRYVRSRVAYDGSCRPDRPGRSGASLSRSGSGP